MADSAPPTLKELNEYAEANFPEAFKVFKNEVKKIMKPTYIPPYHNPTDAGSPQPDYKDWVLPDPQTRNRLHMEKHLVLLLGFYKTPNVKPRDNLFVFLDHSLILRFGRRVRSGPKAETFELTHTNELTIEGVVLFPLWKALNSKAPQLSHSSHLVNAVAYLHLVRNLLSSFSLGGFGLGSKYVNKEGFKAMVLDLAGYPQEQRNALVEENAAVDQSTERVEVIDGMEVDLEHDKPSHTELEAKIEKLKADHATEVEELEVKISRLEKKVERLEGSLQTIRVVADGTRMFKEGE